MTEAQRDSWTSFVWTGRAGAVRTILLMTLLGLLASVLIVPWELWVAPAPTDEVVNWLTTLEKVARLAEQDRLSSADLVRKRFEEEVIAARFKRPFPSPVPGPGDRLRWLSEERLVVYAPFWTPPDPQPWRGGDLELQLRRAGTPMFYHLDTPHRRLVWERLVLQSLSILLVGLIAELLAHRGEIRKEVKPSTSGEHV